MDKGEIKIYFGYAAGVGKTYNMLKDAHEFQKMGIDIVIGYIEPHGRKDTMDLTEGLEAIPLKNVSYKGIELKEFNLETALKRHPQIILLDELAHTNAEGCKNAKRYQDVLELQNHGITVWTTLNVQHLDGINDLMDKELGVVVNERVPDFIFDSQLTQVKIIDVEPKELLQRFKNGKIYKLNMVNLAINNFFTTDHLLTLREICFRRVSERINLIKQNGINIPKILVLISPSPSSSKLIRVAARMAKNSNTNFIALYIASASRVLNEETDNNLNKNFQLVKDLGGILEIKYSSDIIEAIHGFVSLNQITSIVIGKTWNHFGQKRSLDDRISRAFSNIEVLIVPDVKSFSAKTIAQIKWTFRTTMMIVGILLLVTASVCFALDMHIGGIVSYCLLFLEVVISTYFAIKNYYYKKRISSHAKITDCYDYLLLNIKDKIGDEKIVEIAKSLSNIFSTSIYFEYRSTEVKVKYKDDDISFFDDTKEVAIRSWVLLNGQEAGVSSNSLSNSNIAYFPINVDEKCVGVIAFLCQNDSRRFSINNRVLLYKLLPLIKSIL